MALEIFIWNHLRNVFVRHWFIGWCAGYITSAAAFDNY